MYEVGSTDVPARGWGCINYELPYTMPVYEDGKWSYKNLAGRALDRQKVEDWKTIYYGLEGWDTTTGWPTRTTLESVDLAHVADALEGAGKLGKA
jgi:aldehyde:ferredoxin oxidoreductase